MTSRAKFRVAGVGDAERIAQIYAPNVRDTIISFEASPPSGAEMAARIDATTQQFPWLVGEIDSQIVGYCYASAHRSRAAYQWACDVSVYVASDSSRKGVASALYSKLFVLLKHQGYAHAFAGIALPNPPSVALHEHLGFESIARFKNVGYKLGAWHDVGWWQLQLSALDDAPTAPLRFTDLEPELITRLLG